MRKAALLVGAMLTMGLTPLIPPKVELAEPTGRYAHAVLGDALEWGALRLMVNHDRPVFTYALPPDRVFEDIEARYVSFSHEARSNIVVVESHLDRGARLAVYGYDYKTIWEVAATPFIGQRNRWLAPAGIADFDGDGQDDIAYVETPHLSGTLKIVTLEGDALVPVATPISGFSNHRIGDDFIVSDVRTCGDTAELLLPDRAWFGLLAVRVEDGRIVTRALPYPPDPSGIELAHQCED